MKPIRTLFLGAALSLAPLAIAVAADAPAVARPAHPGHRSGAPLQALLRHLDLSADQQARVKSIHDTVKPRVDALRETTAHNRDALATTPPTDPSYASLVEQSKANAAAAIQLRSDAWSQIYAVLTHEQRAKVPALVAAARDKRRERRQHWTAHDEVGPT